MKVVKSQLRTGILALLAMLAIALPGAAGQLEPSLTAPGDELEAIHLISLHQQLEQQRQSRTHYYGGLTTFQDLLLRVLRDSPDADSFGEQMDRLSPAIERFFHSASHCYELVYPKINPQTSHGLFLNTYKTGRLLDAKERNYLFHQERRSYERDKQVEPFLLDADALAELEPEITYNFVLLPDQTVYAALEKPNSQPYQAGADAGRDQPLAYPNHSILAGIDGDPEQGIVTGGALILHREGDKQLWFISNKSGHFLPSVESLDHMREWLIDQGIDPALIVPVMELNYAKHAFLRPELQLDVALQAGQARRLAEHAFDLWMSNYHPERLARIARQLAEHPEKGLDDSELILALNAERQNAFRLRAAFALFDTEHRAPKALRSYTKWLGKMKEGLELCRPEDAQKGAQKLLPWLEKLEPAHIFDSFNAAEPAEIDAYIQYFTKSMQGLRMQWMLQEEHYHQLKKDVRTLSFLFWLLAEDSESVQIQMNREVYRRLTNINVQMGEVLDRIAVEGESGQKLVRISNTVKRRLGRILSKIEHQPQLHQLSPTTPI